MADIEEGEHSEGGYAKLIVKNSFWNFFTASIAKLGGLVFTIIVARILQPELFGLYSLAMSVMLIALTFSDLGINATLIKYLSEYSKNSKKASGYFAYLIKIKIGLTALFAAGLLVLAYPLSNYVFHKPELFLLLVLSSAYLAFLTFVSFFESIFYAMQKIKYVAAKEVFYQILRVSLAVIGIYLFSDKVFGTIAGIMAASILSLILLIILAVRNYSYLYKNSGPIKKEEKSKVFRFLFYLTLSSITSVFFFNIDTVLLGIFVQSEFIGYYRAAFTIIGAVNGLLAITNLLLPIFVKLNGERLERAFNKILEYSAMISFPAAFGIILVSKPFITAIYGSSYAQAAIPLYILSLIIIESSLSSPFVWLFAAKEKPEISTRVLVIATVLNIVLNTAFILYFIQFGMIYAVIGAAAATVISRYFNLIALARLSKKSIGLTGRSRVIAKPFLASLAMVALVLLFRQFIPLSWPFSIAEIFIAAAAYLAMLLAIKALRKEDISLIKSYIISK